MLQKWTADPMDLSAALEQECRRLKDAAAGEMAALIPLLLLGQQQPGYTPADWFSHVATRLGLPLARVQSVASCLPGLSTVPLGRHTIVVCRSLSCRLMGSDAVRAHLVERLSIGPGETTADGSITWLEADCLGSCSTAPAVLVDGWLHESLTLARLDTILESLR